jgi:hypothetical protein
LRIAKRGGRPRDLFEQLRACSAAFQEYIDAHGALPSDQQVHDILDCHLAWEQHRPWIKERRAEAREIFGVPDEDDSESKRKEADRLIRRGALQVVASMLLDQLSQACMGESDVHAGIRLMNEAAAERRIHRTGKKYDLREVIDKLTKSESRKRAPKK